MCTRAAKKFEARNDKDKIILRASIENQNTIYRPDDQGQLQLVRDQQWFQDEGFVLTPPSKGIKPRWAVQRIFKRSWWVNGQPPEPDYSGLDQQPWRHGPETEHRQLAIEDQPDYDGDQEAVLLDCRIQDFFHGLTEEERWEARLADQRLDDIDIPDIVWARANAQKKAHGKRTSKSSFCKTCSRKAANDAAREHEAESRKGLPHTEEL